MILPEASRQCAAGSQKKKIQNRSCPLKRIALLIARRGDLIHVDLCHKQQVEDAELIRLLQVV
jgi:hypothetical protein